MKTEKLTIYHYNGSTYTDYSTDLFNYAYDKVTLPLTTSGNIFIGFRKPINSIYVELNRPNTAERNLTIEYFTTAWTALNGLEDYTRGFKRSGFITWGTNQSDEAKTTVDSNELYWYRITTDSDFDTYLELQGINIVFSDDNDLREEIVEIDDFLATSENSFILKHVASRNEIIQRLRRDGKFKVDSAGDAKDINAFDLLNFDQLRQASKYLTLSKIFFDLHNNTDDPFYQKYQEFKTKYNMAVDVFYLDIDRDDDGIKDEDEELSIQTFRMIRR